MVSQFPLFTPLGRPYSPEQQRADLCVLVCQSLAVCFGETETEEPCPGCESPLRIVLHPSVPIAYCDCGYFLEITDGKP